MPVKIGSLTLYDIMELSAKLNLNPVTLRNYIKQGRLRGQKVGTKWYVSEDSLRNFFGESYHGDKREKSQ